ncbi:hypothetical protein MKW98_011225 [Papaver atlanticum]|uniref:Uncharacterized protein n=1 Tax=Papaver atlanticum TaxID=357466 RepID=A0AAD4SVJ6_9MAGN|nr:hypothetical protein MKW98_011225 [Papaver atlanticum]
METRSRDFWQKYGASTCIFASDSHGDSYQPSIRSKLIPALWRWNLSRIGQYQGIRWGFQVWCSLQENFNCNGEIPSQGSAFLTVVELEEYRSLTRR